MHLLSHDITTRDMTSYFPQVMLVSSSAMLPNALCSAAICNTYYQQKQYFHDICPGINL